jgi:hypothetical protein
MIRAACDDRLTSNRDEHRGVPADRSGMSANHSGVSSYWTGVSADGTEVSADRGGMSASAISANGRIIMGGKNLPTWFTGLLLLSCLVLSSCQDDGRGQHPPLPQQTPSAKPNPPASAQPQRKPARYPGFAGELFFSTHAAIGPNVFVQVRQPPEVAIRELAIGTLQALALAPMPGGLTSWAVRRVFIVRPGADKQVSVTAMVVLRHGYLEHLLTTQSAGKNHESVLAADIDALHLHVALLAIGAKPGKPMEYREENGRRIFVPPQGEPIVVQCAYRNAVGDLIVVPAQRWVRDVDKKQTLQHDWVFVGSRFLDIENTGKPTFFGANLGRVICVANFPVALLDLPVLSSDKEQEGLLFEANTEAIPPLQTPVSVWLSRREK